MKTVPRLTIPKRIAHLAAGIGLAFAGALPLAGGAQELGISAGTPGIGINGNCSVDFSLGTADCPSRFEETLFTPRPSDALRNGGSGSIGQGGVINASAGNAAAASMGALGTRAVASASSALPNADIPHITATASASAEARWVDRLTASPTGVAHGTRANLLINLPLSGGLGVGPTGIPLPLDAINDSFSALVNVRVKSWDTRISNSATGTITNFGEALYRFQAPVGAEKIFRGNLFNGLTDLPTAVTVSVPITIGTPFWLDVDLRSSAGVGVGRPDLDSDDPRFASPRTGSASSEFLSTLAWEVPTLMLQNGTTISMPGLTSLSGTDYNVAILSVAAIPEPGTLALCALGLALLGFHARRRTAASMQR